MWWYAWLAIVRWGQSDNHVGKLRSFLMAIPQGSDSSRAFLVDCVCNGHSPNSGNSHWEHIELKWLTMYKFCFVFKRCDANGVEWGRSKWLVKIGILNFMLPKPMLLVWTLGLNSETPHSFGMSALGAYFWNALIIKGAGAY